MGPFQRARLAILGAVNRRAKRDPIFGLGEAGFAGWSKSKANLDAAVKLKAVRACVLDGEAIVYERILYPRDW